LAVIGSGGCRGWIFAGAAGAGRGGVAARVARLVCLVTTLEAAACW
jgi:hypothetical protein